MIYVLLFLLSVREDIGTARRGAGRVEGIPYKLQHAVEKVKAKLRKGGVHARKAAFSSP